MNTELIDRILERVDEKAIVSLASDLIKIPSFKPDETPVADYLAAFFNERGYEVDLQDVEPQVFRRARISVLRHQSKVPCPCKSSFDRLRTNGFLHLRSW